MSEAASIPMVQGAKQASSFAMIRALGGIALVSGVLLAITYQATFGIIKRNKEEAVRNAVFAVLPGAQDQRRYELSADGVFKAAEGNPTGLPQVFAGFDGAGQFVGVAIEAVGLGYGDPIRVLYGYSPEKQEIVGFKVLDSKETPGLGDKIAKEPFLDNFKAMDVTLDDSGTKLVHPLELAKHGTKTHAWQIDGISGATISSTAVTKMLRESTDTILPLVKAQLDLLKEAK